MPEVKWDIALQCTPVDPGYSPSQLQSWNAPKQVESRSRIPSPQEVDPLHTLTTHGRFAGDIPKGM